MSKRTELALSHLTTKVPTALASQTVGDVKKLLLDRTTDFTSIHYTYIVDTTDRLVGVISIKEVLQTDDAMSLAEFCLAELVCARRHSSAERVAHLAIKHNISAVPIVDGNKKLLGVVTADDIHDILNLEHSRDILQFAGIKSEHSPGAIIFDERPSAHLRARLPWLLLGLVGGIVAAIVVGQYEEALHSHIILAAFIPAIVYVADSVGGQTQMIFIRALALNHSLSIRTYVGREIMVNVMLALILGAIIFLTATLWLQQIIVGVILGVSVFLTVLVSVVIAILLPYLSQKFHKDPAIASGPLATVCRDILSLLIYLSVAVAFLPYL